MVLSIIPAFLMGGVSSYGQLLAYGFLIGIALASFSVGVAFVNGWFRQNGRASHLAFTGPEISGNHWRLTGRRAGGRSGIQVGILDLRHIAHHLAGDLCGHGA